MTLESFAELLKRRITLRKEDHGLDTYCINKGEKDSKLVLRISVMNIPLDDLFEITIREIPKPVLVGVGEYYE